MKNELNKFSFLPSLIRWLSKQNVLQCSYSRKMDNFIGLFERKDSQVYPFRPILPYFTPCAACELVFKLSENAIFSYESHLRILFSVSFPVASISHSLNMIHFHVTIKLNWLWLFRVISFQEFCFNYQQLSFSSM